MKSGYLDGQVDIEQLEDYAKMIEILSDKEHKHYKALISILGKNNIKNLDKFDTLVEVRYIVMPGKENKESKAVTAIREKIKSRIQDENIRELIPVTSKLK